MDAIQLLQLTANFRAKHGYPQEQFMLTHDCFNHCIIANVVKDIVPQVICEDGFVQPSEEGEAVADYVDAVVRGKRLPKAITHYFSDEVVAALHQAATEWQQGLEVLAFVRTLKV